jgi:hypothetical protein
VCTAERAASGPGPGLGDPDLHWQVACRQISEYTGFSAASPARPESTVAIRALAALSQRAGFRPT